MVNGLVDGLVEGFPPGWLPLGRRAFVKGRITEDDCIVDIGAGGVLRIYADTMCSMGLRRIDRLEGHIQNIALIFLAEELTVYHLFGSRYGKIQIFDFRHKLEGFLDIFDSRPNPAAKVNGLQDAHLLKLQVRPQVVRFMLRGRESKLALIDSHLVEIDVYHRLFQFRKPEFGSLHAIAVGYIDQKNLTHFATCFFSIVFLDSIELRIYDMGKIIRVSRMPMPNQSLLFKPTR